MYSTQLYATDMIKLDFNSLPAGVSFNHQQKRIMEKILNGYTYKVVAADLNISLQAVRQCAHRTYKKLGVTNRTEALIRYGMKG